LSKIAFQISNHLAFVTKNPEVPRPKLDQTRISNQIEQRATIGLSRGPTTSPYHLNPPLQLPARVWPVVSYYMVGQRAASRGCEYWTRSRIARRGLGFRI